MSIELSIQRESVQDDLPDDDCFRRWVTLALQGAAGSVTLRLVDEAEGRQLNARYRDKNRPTNVLSFPAELPDAVREALDPPPLGDLVICAPVVAAEARAQRKPSAHHWAHLTVHGVLHLLGHTHDDPGPAAAMEGIETRLLATLGIPDPYLA